jgi:rRNA maturation endonuclease Nob1
MLEQLTFDQINKQFKGYADKIAVQRVMLTCSACKNYVGKDHTSCPRCGALFVWGP